MISWIQHHLIRHGRWIFISLLAIIIIAFVFTIGNTPGLTTNDSNYEKRVVFGVDINNPNQMDKLAAAVSMSRLLQTKTEFNNNDQFQNALANRIVQLHLLKAIQIPRPDSVSLQTYITTIPYFQDDNGQFENARYNSFLSLIKDAEQMDESTFIEVLSDDYRIKELESVIEGPGYYTDAQIRIITDKQNTLYEIYNVKLDYESYKADVDTSESNLKAYFDGQQFKYETSEKLNVSYLLFSSTEDTPKIPKQETLESYYQENKERFKKSFLAEYPDSEINDLTYQKVKNEVEEDWINKARLRSSEERASEFVYTIYDKSIPLHSDTFYNLIDSYGVEEINLDSYSRNEVYNKALPAKILTSAFNLTQERYYSDPYEIPDGFIVLIYQETIPSEIPSFESVSDRVEVDYVNEEKRSQFNTHGVNLKTELEAIIASEKDFQSEVEDMGLNLEPYPEFSFSNPPENANPYEFQAVYQLKPGEISDLFNYGGIGIITYLKSTSVLDYEEDLDNLERLKKNIKSYSKSSAKADFYNELLAIELSEEIRDNIEED